MSTLKLKGSSSGEAEVTVAAAAGTPTFTLPTTVGSANQLLKNSGTAGTLEYSSNLTFDGSDLTVVGEVQIGDTSNHTKELRFADSTRVDASSIKVDNSTANLLITNDRGGGEIKFACDSTERVSIDDTGDLKIADGDLVIGTAGHGIDFSATSDVSGMSSELLDDYEEGTWTPTLGSSGGSAAGNGAYVEQAGTYTKVGNIVTVQCYLNWDANWTGAGGNFAIPLPFTANSSTPTYGGVYIGFLKHSNGAIVGANHSVGGYVSGSNALFQQIPQGTQSGSQPGGAIGNAAWSAGAGYVQFNATFRV